MRNRRQAESIVAFVMAGGQGKRLRPLTDTRCKPAVPFGSHHRLVDFVLSNLVNSDIRAIYVLVQYKAQSIIEHIRKGWTISPLLPDQFVTVVPPQMQGDTERFQGTADAVYQSLHLLSVHQPDLVAIYGADHVYRMDIRQMVRFHRDRKADVSSAALPVPLEIAKHFGVVDVDSDDRVLTFKEKNAHVAPMPSNPSRAYASMGNYLFNTEVLLEALDKMHTCGEVDFAYHVLPKLIRNHRIYAYDFSSNEIPGMKNYEETGYWRDVGTLDSYFEAHQDLLGRTPRFDTFNPQWPIFSSSYQGPAAMVFNSNIDNCMLGEAVVIDGANIRNTIIRRESVIEPDVILEDCIIMDYVRICQGARLRRVIVDRHNVIEPRTKIGFDGAADRARYPMTSSGLVIVPRGRPTYYARESRARGFGYQE